MPDFKRRRGESAAAWCTRLGAVDMAALSPRQLEELTLRRVLAGQALQREVRSRLRKAAAPPDEADDAPESEALRRCKEAVRALSAEDRRQLLRWVEAFFVE